MRKIALLFLAIVLWAGGSLTAATPALAANLIPPNRYPLAVTLDSHGVQPVNGKYFFKAGQRITIAIAFDASSSTCTHEGFVEAKVDMPGYNPVSFQIDAIPGQDSYYAPLFHHTVAAGATSGKIALVRGPTLCGTGDDYYFNPGDNYHFDDGSEMLANDYFISLFTPEIYIDTSAPTIAFGKASDTSYQRTHGVTVSTTDAPVNSNVLLYYAWTQSATPPAAASIDNLMMNGAQALDPSGSGTYYLHAKAVDAAGNITIRTAGPFNYDQQQPDIAISPMFGAAGAGHTVQYAATDALSGIREASYKWYKDGTYHSGGSGASGTLQVPNVVEGDYKLEVTAVDTAGNSKTAESLDFVIDRTPPSIAFSTQGSGIPAMGRQVDVTLQDARATLGPAYYQWSGSAASPAADDSGWQPFFDGAGSKAAHTATVSTPPGADGSLYLHVKAQDSAGNVGFADTPQAFVLDNTKPAVTFTNPGNSAYSAAETTRLNITDGGSSTPPGITIKYTITEQAVTDGDDAAWSTSGDGQFTLDNRTGIYYIHAKVYDQAGNWTLATGGPYRLDHSPPAGSIQTANTMTNNSLVPVALSATDQGTQAAQFQVLIDGAPSGGWQEYTGAMEVDVSLPEVEGSHSIGVKYRDTVGNVSPVYEISVVYDTTPPAATQIAYSTQAWTNGPVTATLSVTDNLTPAGGIAVDPPGAVYEFHDNGTHTFRFQDLAGNIGTAVASVTWIDKQLPIVSLSVDGSPEPRRSVSTVIAATDNGPGPLAYEYAWSQEAVNEPAVWTPLGPDRTATLNGADGIWYLWAKATDPAGNAGKKRSNPFTLDNTAPVGTVSYNPVGRTAGTVTATLGANEAITITSPGSGSEHYIFEQNGSFDFVFHDAAGNVGTVTASVYHIDKNTPSANVSYSTTGWTNEPVRVTIDAQGSPPRSIMNLVVPADAIPVSQTVTKVVYDFPSNGSFQYQIIDLDTGVTSDLMTHSVRNIDKIAPSGTLSYNPAGGADTKTDVTVTLAVADDRPDSVITILNNGGSPTYTFTENGTFTFLFRDNAGNLSQVTATVSNIDREPPHAVATYSETAWTRNNVTTAVTFPNESKPVTITNNNGSPQVTFTENGTFELHYMDAAGNTGSTLLRVDNIDRTAPTGRVVYSQSGWTNQDVVATLVAADAEGQVTVVNNGGQTAYTFTENGKYTFEFRDEAGNVNTVTAAYDRIDKVQPALQIQYSTLAPTNADVRAIVVANEPITVVGNNGSAGYDFSANGSYTFEVRDRAGNAGTVTASVYWIDRTPPVPTLSYSSTAPTKDNVIVTVTAGEPIVVLNNNRSPQYVFRENGRFTFIVQDMAGNVAEIEAAVGNIDKTKANVTFAYSETAPTQNPVTVTIVTDRPLGIEGVTGNSLTFAENGTRWLVATDERGNRYDLRVEVKNIDHVKPVVRFEGGEQLLLSAGSIFDPLADVQATDNLDGNVLPQVTVTHNVNPQVPGTYTITYSVTDRAGHTTVATRNAVVVAPTSFTLYVNSQPLTGDEALAYGNAIQLKAFGTQGANTVKWLRGFKAKGDFKLARTLVEQADLPISEYGYYTFYVQDQERQTKLVHIYILPESVRQGGASGL